ncbi:MAG: type IV secretion system protein [Rickettsiales bacterium]|nr:type IV secretion system protein [Rickettsiales bacterium]
MIKNLLKHFYQESHLAKAALLLSLFAFSCADQGCIDADDFGEFESQTIEVSANAAQNSCNYDLSKPLDDSDFQGAGVRLCFISGEKSVTDENNVTQTVAANADPAGCEGFADAAFKNLCISQCVQDCQMKAGSGSITIEPTWTSTSKRSSTVNDGVTIIPGAEITVNAIGSISLGDSANYPSTYVQANNNLPHSKLLNWGDLFFDVRASQTLDLKFSGNWGNGEQDFGAGAAGISNAGNDLTDSKIYNGAKRLAAFTIAHPAGYSFNASRLDEMSGSIGTPLLPDRNLWRCEYSPDGLYAKASCHGGDYEAGGYAEVDNTAALTAFPVSSAIETKILGTNGGMIKWDGDEISPDSYDPFADPVTVTCSYPDGNCSGFDPNSMPRYVRQLIGDAKNSQVVILSPSTKDSYKVSFKNLSSNSACNSIKIWIKDGASTDSTLGNILDNGGGSAGRTITISQTDWSSDHISLEPNQKIVIDQMNTDCGKVIGVKFGKYKDIEIKRSGLVSLGLLKAQSGVGSGSCNIKGRIINPNGSHSDATFSSSGAIAGYSADFYEYDNFLSTSSKDPLGSGINISADSWSSEFFVRKGQKIRLSPESWDDTWSAGGMTARCYTGLAMHINPRPALLCRGQRDDLIQNPNCTPEYSGSTLIGCKSAAKECLDSATSAYCPIEACQKSISCTNNADIPNEIYAKSGCSITGTVFTSCPPWDETCKVCSYNRNEGDNQAPFTSESTCDSCSALSKLAAESPVKISLPNIDQCYDLENYNGKVANINIATGFEPEDLDNPDKAKNAVKISQFNGSYGNFENFYDTKTQDSDGNRLFKSSSPAIFTQAGRLKFFLLDGNDFNGTGGITNAYSDNSISGDNYSGSNGIKISLSGMLNFSNGQWMEVRLCKESSDSSVSCRTTLASLLSTLDQDDLSSPITKLSEQPKLIEIIAPTSASEASSLPAITTPYKFDSSGNLVRTRDKESGNDCIQTYVNSYFYCHTHNYFTDKELEQKTDNGRSEIANDTQKLRLSFKIIDPEIANCNIADPLNPSAALDGILLTNSFYNSSESSFQGKTCDAKAGEKPGAEEDECQKQFYCASKYANNSGSYFVKIRVKNPSPSGVSSFIGDVIKPIIQVMDGDGGERNCSSTGGSSYDGIKTNNPLYAAGPGNDDEICLANQENCTKQYYCKIANSVGQAERVYRALISDTRYKAIVSMCIIVMFTFYGVGFLMGVSELNHSELINRIVKISLIYLFIGETGWDWFNLIVVKFFKNSVDYLAFMMASSFDSSPAIQTAIDSGNYYDKSVLFASVDQVFNLLFSDVVWKKIQALLFASIFGWLYLAIIVGSFFIYIIAIANAVFLYLVAQVFISILFTLGPIFFIFTLFPQTKEMFDNWLKQLIAFSLQQIFLLTTLAFFNMLMYEVIKLSLGYKICWNEVWSINIMVHVSLLSAWTIASLPTRTNAQSSVGNIGNTEGIPSLFSILFIWVIASLMKEFITFMTNVAATISGGLKASEVGAGLKAAAVKLGGQVASTAYGRSGLKNAVESAGNFASRLDDKFFDHGKIADKTRKDKKKLGADKEAMEKAGDSAVSKYKSSAKGASELAALKKPGMSAADVKKAQQAKLNSVKNDAMKTKGKALGYEGEKLDAIMSDKNINTGGGNNIYGVGKYAAKLAYRSAKGTNNKSISEKDATASFSAAEKTAALKGMTKEERAAFAASGIETSRSTVGKMLGAGGDARRSLAEAFSGKKTKKSNADEGAAIKKSLRTKEGRQALMESLKSDKTRAIEQLEAEGEIHRMRSGFGFARSDEDKAKIAERVKLNKAQSSKADDKKPDLNATADLADEIAYLNDLDDIDAEADATDRINEALANEGGGKVKKFNRKLAKRKAGAARNNIFSDRKANARESIAKNNNSQNLSALEKDLTITQEEQKINDEEIGGLRSELSAIDEKHAADHDMASLREAATKTHSLPKRLASPAARKEHEEALKAQATLKKLTKEKDEPNAKLNKALNTQKNLAKKSASLKESISDLKSSMTPEAAPKDDADTVTSSGERDKDHSALDPKTASPEPETKKKPQSLLERIAQALSRKKSKPTIRQSLREDLERRRAIKSAKPTEEAQPDPQDPELLAPINPSDAGNPEEVNTEERKPLEAPLLEENNPTNAEQQPANPAKRRTSKELPAIKTRQAEKKAAPIDKELTKEQKKAAFDAQAQALAKPFEGDDWFANFKKKNERDKEIDAATEEMRNLDFEKMFNPGAPKKPDEDDK